MIFMHVVSHTISLLAQKNKYQFKNILIKRVPTYHPKCTNFLLSALVAALGILVPAWNWFGTFHSNFPMTLSANAETTGPVLLTNATFIALTVAAAIISLLAKPLIHDVVWARILAAGS